MVLPDLSVGIRANAPGLIANATAIRDRHHPAFLRASIALAPCASISAFNLAHFGATFSINAAASLGRHADQIIAKIPKSSSCVDPQVAAIDVSTVVVELGHQWRVLPIILGLSPNWEWEHFGLGPAKMFDHNLRLLSAIFSRGLAASPISTAASEGSCAGASGNAAKAFAAGSAPAFLSICPPPPGLFPLAGGFVACANQTKKGSRVATRSPLSAIVNQVPPSYSLSPSHPGDGGASAYTAPNQGPGLFPCRRTHWPARLHLLVTVWP
jgi:hypothetical protein